MNLREDSIKYDYLVVFIRHGSAEIWGFQYGVTLGLGTLEIMARTGFFSPPPPKGAGASAIQLLSRVPIKIRGRCGGQLRGGSNFPFRSLHSGPRLHGNDGRAHSEPARGTGGPVGDAPIRGGP